MKKGSEFLVFCLVVALAAASAVAAPIIVDVPDDASGTWLVGPVPPQGTTYGSVGEVGTQANVSVPSSAFSGGGPYEDLFFYNSGNLTGYDPNALPPVGRGIVLDFYTGGAYVPYTVSVYFQANGAYWYYDLPAANPSGWTSYWQIFDDAGWYSTTPSVQMGSAAFLADLATGVDQVGVRILYDDSIGGNQTFSINNMGYAYDEAIPEPGTYMLLSTAVMSLGYTFARRRRSEKKA